MLCRTDRLYLLVSAYVNVRQLKYETLPGEKIHFEAAPEMDFLFYLPSFSALFPTFAPLFGERARKWPSF